LAPAPRRPRPLEPVGLGAGREASSGVLAQVELLERGPGRRVEPGRPLDQRGEGDVALAVRRVAGALVGAPDLVEQAARVLALEGPAGREVHVLGHAAMVAARPGPQAARSSARARMRAWLSGEKKSAKEVVPAARPTKRSISGWFPSRAASS